ncbi:uncharacterized protein LOC125668343 [Ostrea edulis]|uniref:uncharacterized protein LOC125668343 n=1 Tax=Ostrea edulis TaxID=37623 RepID=UPI0024AF8B4B|nr:uncharacterized protein LOC125668343 [Ostrea edulis]
MKVLVSILSCLLLCGSYSPSVSNAQKTMGDVRFDMRSSKALVLDSEMCVVVKKCSISVNRVSDRQSTDSGQAPDGDQQSTDSIQAQDGLLVLPPELLTGLQEITTSAPPPEEEPGMGAMLGATPELLRNS